MSDDETVVESADYIHIMNINSSSLNMVQDLPVAIYACDTKGYVTQYNKAAVELWGYEPAMGLDLWHNTWRIYDINGSVMDPAEYPMTKAINDRRIIRGMKMIIERSTGQRYMVASNPAPLYDDAGTLIGCVDMLSDITLDKESEAKLGSLAAIIESSDDAIVSKTLDGIVTSWNNAAERMFGYTAEEMIGQPLFQLFPADRMNEEPHILERLKRGERIDHFETVRITKDKQLLNVSLTISPIKDSNGNIIGASKIARDITKQRQAERLIKESEERFRMAIASTNIGTWDYDIAGNELTWSEECRKIYDVPEDMEINMDLFAKLIHPDDMTMVQEHIAAATAPGSNGDYDIEFRIIRYSDKTYRWVRSQGKVYFDGDKAIRFIGTALDTTDEKAVKQTLESTVQYRTIELERANHALERTNNELEEFAYVASHDLQEPLRKIKVFADRVLIKGQEILPDDLNTDLRKIVASSEKMSVLIKDLLNYATVQPAELKYQPTDLNAILRSVTDDLDIIISNNNALVTSDELPTIEVIPLQANQLFYNILNNSLKFSSSERRPAIHIRSEILSPQQVKTLGLAINNQYCKIQITDNGIGFGEEYSKRIFTIFQRLNNKDMYPGTGIGLALCKKVVDNHNGLIFAEGKENEGAKFTIILPFCHY